MQKKFPKLSGKIVLAPMHNITNLAFRLICKKYGASLVWTELLSAHALARENKSTTALTLTDKSEKPVVAQIFGQDVENIVQAGKVLEKKFNIIDFNLGCPSKKIISQGCSAALLKRKNKIYDILSELNKAVEIPITTKIRSGIDGRENAVEIAKVCEDAGVSAIIIHARMVEQGYSGKADWSVIKKVKESVKIPVIGNGDVWSGKDARRMLNETGCDYVMIGRASIGNPFIFKQINEYLKKDDIVLQTKEERIKDFFDYIELTKEYNIFSLVDAKLRAQEFTKGLYKSAKLRKKLNTVKNFDEMKGIIIELLTDNP